MTASLTPEYLDALVAKLEYWAKSMLIGGTPLGEHVLSAANATAALDRRLLAERNKVRREIVMMVYKNGTDDDAETCRAILSTIEPEEGK